MPEAEAEPNPFWDYSLARYALPGVAEACIGLQDRLGADVNLLLFCGWAGHRGHRLSAAELDGLLAAGRAWQDEVVRPLRALRRHLKPEAGGSAAVAALRDGIKDLELAAERIAQDRLQAGLPLGPGAPSDAAVAANLGLYAERLARPVAEADAAALAALRAALL